MATLAEIRQQYPQYNNLSDGDLADRLYNKFYAGKIDRSEFNSKLGLSDDTWERANILPVAINTATGERSLAVPGIVKNALDVAKLPGQIYTDEKQLSELTPADTLGFAALATPVNPAYRAGDRAIPGLARREMTKPGAAPKSAALREASGEQFDAFRSSGANVRVDAAAAFANAAKGALEKDGFLEPDAKSTYNVLKMLGGGPKGGYLSPAGIHSARKALGRIAGNYANPTDQAAASRLIKMLDEFFEKLPEAGFVDRTAASRAAGARELFRDAKGNFAAAERSDTLTGKLHAAELRAAAANSGRNVDNAIRQRLAGVAITPSAGRGFSKEEIGQVEGVVQGTRGMNAARTAGNLMGGGGGLGAVVTGAVGGAGAAALTANPLGALLGAAVPATGWGLKALENQLARKAVGRVDEATRARSPLAGKQPKVPIRPGESPGVGEVSAKLVAQQRPTTRKESLAVAESVVGTDVMNHIKKTPHLRSLLQGWLVARHRNKDIEGATMALANAIADEVARPDLVQRIIDELNSAQGPQ